MQEYKLYHGKILIKFEGDEEGEKHAFYDEQGNRLLSVTAITGLIDKSPALMGWAIKLMGQYLLDQKAKGNDKITKELVDTAKRKYREAQKEARDIGKDIHKWISRWIKGEKPEMPEDEKVINGITAFLKFQKENKLKWLESERVIYSKKWNYAGFLDALGQKGKETILVDFKSSNDIYPEMILQVAGYKIAWEEEMKKKINRAMIIKFGKATGEFKVRELEAGKKDEEAFLGLIPATRRLKVLKGQKEQPGSIV